MKKFFIAIAFAFVSVIGVSAQESENSSVYLNGISNLRFGYAGVLNSSDSKVNGGFEFGFNIIEFGVRPYESGAISLGADFILDEFSTEKGYYYNTVAHKTEVSPALPGFKEISGSRASVCAFGFPLNFTQRLGDKLEVTVGASAKVNINADTWVDYTNITDDRCTLSVYGIPTNRLTYDVHMAVSYENFGIYATYSPMKVFAEGAGPSFNFFSVGVILRNFND